jgi:hypothetical protein
MGVIVGLAYFAVLSIVMVFAVGGIGLPIAIIGVLAYMLVSELMKAKGLGNRPDDEEHSRRNGHHVP